MCVLPQTPSSWHRQADALAEEDVVMHAIGWPIASFLLIGLVAVVAEILIRDPGTLLDLLLDSEEFARKKAAPAEPARSAEPMAPARPVARSKSADAPPLHLARNA
jgi:hypothetical protein